MPRLNRRGKRRLTVLIALTLIAASAAVTFRVIRNVQQQRLIADAKQHGLAAYAAGDLKTTLHRLSYFFEHQKEDLAVNLTFAEARARMPLPQGQHLAEAIDLYNTHGLKLLDKIDVPDKRAQRMHILEKLLDLYGKLGLRVEISRTADQLLAMDENSIQALASKGEVLVLDHQFDQADTFVQRLIALDPDDLSWRRLALDIQLGRGAAMEALVDQCRQWAEQYQGDGRFHLLTASILIEMDQADAARQELQSITKLGANTVHVLERSVSLLDLLEMREQADELLRITKERYPRESWVREVIVRRLWHENRLAAAHEELAQARSELPAISTELHRLSVLSLISDRQFENAKAELQWLIKDTSKQITDGDRAWASALVGALDASQSKWRDRIESLGYALALSPEDPVLHFIMGEACMAVGENSQAMLAFRNAYELDSDWMLAGVAYAEALLAGGRVTDAYNVSRAVVTRSPRDQYSPLLVLADSYLSLRRAGEYRQAGAEDDLLDDLIIALEGIHDAAHPDLRLVEALCEGYVQAGQRERAALMVREAANNVAEWKDVVRLFNLSDSQELGVEGELLEVAQQRGADAAALAIAESQWRAASGEIDRALEIVNQALKEPNLDPSQQRQLRGAKVQLMMESHDPSAIGAMRRLIADYPLDVDVQRFAISHPQTWGDMQAVAQTMANLKEILGERSPQVRLAEANFLLRHHAQDDAMLAKAIALITGVLQQTPDSLAGLSLRADAMMIGPRPNVFAAIESLERAASLYPAEPNLLVRLIGLLQRQGEFEAAGRYLATLAQHSQVDPQLHPIELRLLEAQPDFEIALVRAASLVSNQSPPPDQLVLASMHEQAGNRQQAGAIYQRLLAEQPSHELVVSQAAAFFANIGEFDRGLSLMQSMKHEDRPGAHALAIGAFYQRYGRPEAEQWLRRAIEEDPASIEARHMLAQHYLKQQNRSAAREQAIAGLQLSPGDPRMRALAAVASLQSSGPERAEAINSLKQICADDDDLLATLKVLEMAPRGQSVPTQRYLAESQNLIKNHGHFLPAWLLAITLHVASDRTTEAISLARQAVSRFPAEAEPARWSTELLIKTQRYREALADAREWRRRAKSNTIDIDVVIANVLVELGRPGEAVKQLRADAALLQSQCDQHPERFTTWLRALANAGELHRAIELVQPLLNQLKWREAWRTIAMELDPAHAHAALLESDRAAQSPAERLELAALWAELGRRSGKAECLDRAAANAIEASKQPDLLIQALIAQGGIDEARRDWPRAESLYRQAIEHSPDDPVARNNLANVLARTPQRCDEALAHIRRALELSPSNPDFLDTYAMVLVGLNRVEEAESALSQALASRPSDIAIKLNFIDVLLRQDKIDQARDELFTLQQKFQGVLHADPAQQKRLNDLMERLQSHEGVIGT